MKKLLSVAVVSMLLTVCPGVCSAEAEPANSSKTGKVLTSSEARADFDLMRLALEEVHPGLYRYSSKPEMDRGFDAQRAKLTGAITKSEFEAVVAETLALIRCGHTRMNADEEMESAMKNARTFPLRIHVEGRRLIVALNDTPDNHTIVPGMEVVEINGHSAEEIIGRFWPLVSADGDVETGKRHDISGRFSQFYWWRVDQRGEFTVKARDEAGAMVTATLAGVTDADRKATQNPVNATVKENIGKVVNWSREDLSLRFLSDPQVAEIRVSIFAGDNYEKWMQDTFKTLREKGTRTLIIDLRGNGGGEDMFGAMLVSYLTDQPFRYFDHIDVKSITPSFKEHWDGHVGDEAKLREGLAPNPAGGYFVTAKLHPGVAEQQPGKFPFRGKVFVLIDGGVFSTAADFCAVTHHLKRATFIGEETAGGYYGNNSGTMPTLTLSNSKVGIRLPMCGYWNAVSGYAGTRRGTIPDHVVETKIADVLRGVDAPLDRALKLAAGEAALR
jgi:hypothetical protein